MTFCFWINNYILSLFYQMDNAGVSLWRIKKRNINRKIKIKINGQSKKKASVWPSVAAKTTANHLISIFCSRSPYVFANSGRCDRKQYDWNIDGLLITAPPRCCFGCTAPSWGLWGLRGWWCSNKYVRFNSKINNIQISQNRNWRRSYFCLFLRKKSELHFNTKKQIFCW